MITHVLFDFLSLDSISFNELNDQFGMDRHVLMKRLEWWKEKGVLDKQSDNSDVWNIATNSSRFENLNSQSIIQLTSEDTKDNGEEDGTQISIEEQADSLEQYWMYTKSLVGIYYSIIIVF